MFIKLCHTKEAFFKSSCVASNSLYESNCEHCSRIQQMRLLTLIRLLITCGEPEIATLTVTYIFLNASISYAV